jgi:3-hydroxyacyl-CoA dehydrogenase
MDWFMADNPINAWQINRMILAIANNANQVAINQNLSPAEVDSLTRGGMLVPGAAHVTRQNAMAALVRLFEVRTGNRITQPTLAASAFPDIADAAPHLRDALLRAEFLGFLDHGTGLANPHGHLTMGDAMLIFEIILRN